MANKNRIRSAAFFTSNWVITLTATLIGVFMALYLNEWMASRKLTQQKELAATNILAEIASNQESLEASIGQHTKLLGFVRFFSTHYTEENELVVPVDTMQRFKSNYPDLIVVTDSTAMGNGVYKYKGEMNIDLQLLHIEFATIAWETLKNSGITATYGFECLMYLENMDKITREVLQKNKELMAFLSDKKDSGPKNEQLIHHLKTQIQYEEGLLEIYAARDLEFKNCE
ncbi:MAG: hypothetical protein AB3N16_07745 [Flavobacteriaceae bacterium]